MDPVSLQINLTPYDYRFSRYLLKHQLGILHSQVQEVLLVNDTRPRHFHKDGQIDEHRKAMQRLLKEVQESYAKVHVCEVDYSPETVSHISKLYFGKKIPTHDCRGAPIYAYLYGLQKASYDLIFHLDSDIFLGGGSQSWMAEALEILRDDPQVGVVKPHSGPPHPDGILRGQNPYYPYRDMDATFVFRAMTTRSFLLNRQMISGKLEAKRPHLKSYIFSLVNGFSPLRTLENSISALMDEKAWIRVDFLGSGRGLWTLHPSIRTEEFYRMVPEIIRKVEKEELPQAQLGRYNMIPQLIGGASS